MLVRRRATLTRVVGKQAFLTLDNGQELVLLRDELEPAVAGDEYVVQVLPAADAEKNQHELSRTLLNQLLDGVDRPDQNN